MNVGRHIALSKWGPSWFPNMSYPRPVNVKLSDGERVKGVDIIANSVLNMVFTLRIINGKINL